MATRWSFCRLCLTGVVVAACVKSTVREFYPSPENPRYTPERGSAAVREYLRLRCADLAKPPARDSATLLARIRVDSTGKAVAAELNGTSGDPLMDGVIGTVVAQRDLQLELFSLVDGVPVRLPADLSSTYRARVEYACRDSVGARIVISR